MVRKLILAILFLMLGSALYPINIKGATAARLVTGTTLVLYEAASGAVPAAPLMNFIAFPPSAAAPAYGNGVAILDTTTTGMEGYAGWISNRANLPDFPILDRTAGFQVDFTLQVEAESHSSDRRAGFSLILLGHDATGIELAFWEDEIWAQGDVNTGGLFRKGEGAAFTTTSGLTEYQVRIQGDTYTLAANANPILTGPVRDYSAFEGLPDPYETPDFVFLGDDTTSAQARIRLYYLAITGSEPTTIPTTTILSSPIPAASSTPLPNAPPVPSPVPAETGFPLCPPGWILLLVMVRAAGRAKKNGNR